MLRFADQSEKDEDDGGERQDGEEVIALNGPGRDGRHGAGEHDSCDDGVPLPRRAGGPQIP